MVEISDVYFNSDEEFGLGDHLSLHWDSEKEHYMRIKGDITDIEAIIREADKCN